VRGGGDVSWRSPEEGSRRRMPVSIAMLGGCGRNVIGPMT
jgi:hypothetical protein